MWTLYTIIIKIINTLICCGFVGTLVGTLKYLADRVVMKPIYNHKQFIRLGNIVNAILEIFTSLDTNDTAISHLGGQRL